MTGGVEGAEGETEVVELTARCLCSRVHELLSGDDIVECDCGAVYVLTITQLAHSNETGGLQTPCEGY